jgi:hypothetical protein
LVRSDESPKTRTIGKNIKSPPELSLEQGLNGGWEFAKLSFPRWHLAPHFWGCQLPDAMGHASGVIGLVEGLRSIPLSGSNELLSEAIQLASIDDCATGLQNKGGRGRRREPWVKT